MTNEKLMHKLRIIGLELWHLDLTPKQTSTGAQMEINHAITRIEYAIMALSTKAVFAASSAHNGREEF